MTVHITLVTWGWPYLKTFRCHHQAQVSGKLYLPIQIVIQSLQQDTLLFKRTSLHQSTISSRLHLPKLRPLTVNLWLLKFMRTRQGSLYGGFPACSSVILKLRYLYEHGYSWPVSIDELLYTTTPKELSRKSRNCWFNGMPNRTQSKE